LIWARRRAEVAAHQADAVIDRLNRFFYSGNIPPGMLPFFSPFPLVFHIC
jgi:hypothetical protein